jgi:signal transduction histidine kinase
MMQSESPSSPINCKGIVNDLGYRAILDLLPCYLTVQDRSLHIIFANQSFRKDFGQGVGKLCYEAYKSRKKSCELCPVQKSFEDKKVHISEETVQIPHGETARMIVYSAPIVDIHGDVGAVIEMSTNISKIEEMGEELKFIGQSVAMLSHDMKNILEGLQGGAYVVDEGMKDRDLELVGKGWDIVKRNIGEITSFAQDILYSSSKRLPDYQNVLPAKVVQEVAGLFQEKAKAMNIELEVQANSALPSVRLDPSIRRLLGNLILNALEACQKDEGKEFHKVVVRADFYDEFSFMLEVVDNGVGMDEDAQNKIFKGFYSTKRSGGTGLGLMVVDRILKEHGGKIEVLSAPGKGSTFRVILKLS